MAQCEMCGAESEKLIRGIFEGAEMDVCSKCIKFGKEKKKLPQFRPSQSFGRKKTLPGQSIFEERVVSNAGRIIKAKRDEKGMRQIDLAKMLQIKDSYIHHIETEDMKLPLHIAKKIEEMLDITLVKKFKRENYLANEEEESKGSGMTFGDFLKKK